MGGMSWGTVCAVGRWIGGVVQGTFEGETICEGPSHDGRRSLSLHIIRDSQAIVHVAVIFWRETS
jgi:hypothetical protein